MNKIIAVLNPKGGAGKSTLATNLAVAVQAQGRSVVVVDTDPQGTARDWAASAPEGGGPDLPLVVGIDRSASLRREVTKLSLSHDIVVIDGSARVEDMDAVVLRVADLVLVPVTPSNADIWGSGPLVDLVRARRSVAGQPDAAFVVSRQVAGSNLAAEVGEALETAGLPVLDSRTTQRVAYAEALSGGWGVVGPQGGVEGARDPKAAAEMAALADEVLQRLDAFVAAVPVDEDDR